MRLWPRTLVGQAALVLLLAVFVSNLVGLLVYSGDRLDLLASARGHDLAERIAAALQIVEAVPPEDRRQRLQGLRQPGLKLMWMRQPIAGNEASGLQATLLRRALLSELGDGWEERLRLSAGSLPLPGWVGGRGRFGEGGGDEPGPPPPPRGRPDRPPGGEDAYFGSLRLEDGSWLNFIAAAAVFRPFWATPFFFIVVGTTVAVALVSFWAVRKAARPLSMFADAAERLGRDVNAPPLAPSGPREVERAALAFNGMQTRLQALLRDRLQMLAAMSHDLRTPITRLRLRAELIEETEQQAKMLADLDEIQSMIDATLSYARNTAVAEEEAAFDLAVLVQTVCEEAEDAGGTAAYGGPVHAPARGRPRALKRALANLVENAIKYGERAEVRLLETAEALILHVDDSGPGIPEQELARVFEPFYRIEGSRSRTTGGVGLGLAVVKATIEASGGSVLLSNRPQGGLRVMVRLPKPAATI